MASHHLTMIGEHPVYTRLNPAPFFLLDDVDVDKIRARRRFADILMASSSDRPVSPVISKSELVAWKLIWGDSWTGAPVSAADCFADVLACKNLVCSESSAALRTLIFVSMFDITAPW